MAQERGIKAIGFTETYNWGTKTGTFTDIPIGDILLDGTEIAEPEEFTTETADNLMLQDGIRWNGVIRVALGVASLPTINTPFWIQVTPYSGNARVYGGTNGAKCRIVESGIKSLSNGRAYVDIMYSFVTATIAAGIQDA